RRGEEDIIVVGVDPGELGEQVAEIDADARFVLEKRPDVEADAHFWTMYTARPAFSNEPDGIYFIQIEGDNWQSNHKVILIKYINPRRIIIVDSRFSLSAIIVSVSFLL
ncbi:MAG: hypothetical protein HGA93_02715, partial [Methanothrix sp.]|nr:hypothetical protein [Methanothrix sp.]